MNAQGVHDYNVSKINIKPRKILFNRNGHHELADIVMSGTVNFFNDNGELICQPDGLLFDKWGQMYVFEYKCNNNVCRDKAVHQLFTAEKQVRKYFDVVPRLFYVTGEEPYKVEEIRK